MELWKSDYEHQLYYRWLLDQLEAIWKGWRETYINMSWEDPSISYFARKADRWRRNYNLVKKRYDRERSEREWPH